MKRALPLLLLTLSCLDFERRVSNCFDGGVCAVRSESDSGTDAGADGGAGLDASTPFAPFDAGFFCSDEWCWESPFPHGVRLDTVFAEGDDLVVAGPYGMLAERSAGQWRSLQSQHSELLEWRNLWGRSMTDLWLSGDALAWHRTATGWSTVGTAFRVAHSQAVAGSSTDVYFCEGADVFRLEGEDWVGFKSVNDDVMSLAMAFGALHGAIRNSPGQVAGSVTNLTVGTRWEFDVGAMYTLFATSTALFATGERTVQLDRTLQAQPLADVLRAGVEAEQQLFAANVDGVGFVRDGGFRLERRSPLVNAMAAGRAVVAVGEHGLILERRDGGWVDPTPTVSRSKIIAFVDFNGALAAVTADCELLERGAAGWTRRALGYTNCADAVSDGSSLAVLTPSEVVTLDRNLGVVGQDPLSPGLEVLRLWRSDAGALVVTTTTDVFVRLPEGNFEAVRSLPGVGSGAWGVSGRGSVARVCGFADGSFVDLDLGRNQPVATIGSGPAFECHAVLPLRNGDWALAAVEENDAGQSTKLYVLAPDGGRSTFTIDAPTIEGLLETPTGIAVAAGRYAFVSFDGGTRPVERRGRFDGVTDLGLWKGRLFVGGEGGSILQAPAP